MFLILEIIIELTWWRAVALVDEDRKLIINREENTPTILITMSISGKEKPSELGFLFSFGVLFVPNFNDIVFFNNEIANILCIYIFFIQIKMPGFTVGLI